MTSRQRVGIKSLLVLSAVATMTTYDSASTSIGPLAVVLVPATFFIVLSLWLHGHQRRRDGSIDRSISIGGQFWPMTEHPFQYWALTSAALILGGFASILKVAVLERGHLALGATFLLLGIAVGLAVLTQSRRKFR